MFYHTLHHNVLQAQTIKLFARAVINYGGIPFEVKTKQPSSDTASAIHERLQGKVNNAHS